MDIADMAGERIDVEMELLLAARREAAAAAGESADECSMCGGLIPSERQIAVPGCQFCVECAEVMERHAAGYAR